MLNSLEARGAHAAAVVPELGIVSDPLAAAATRVCQLQAWLEQRHGGVERIETHISWVLLAGTQAYKIKKPLRLGFLDYGTLEARRRCCEEELRLNRRLAPELYLGVVPVHRTGAGVSLLGPGPVIEYAVRMQRLPPQAIASGRLARGTLELAHLVRLARRLDDLHRSAPAATPDSPYASAQRVLADAQQALQRLAEHSPLAAARAPLLRSWFAGQAEALAPRFAARRQAGRVREGHGDLHLDNIIVLGEQTTAFDGIDFDPGLRWIDVMNDIAYLVMDLLAHGRRDLAYGFLDAYLESSGDHDGLAVLRYYLVHRAVVRALVAALRAECGAAADGLPVDDYVKLALRLAEPAQGRLLITHGLPGSGKTHVTQQLLERAGAVRVRSDVERKRLAGLAAEADSRRIGDLYTAAATEATYASVLERAGSSLRAGFPTVIDAAFLRRTERKRARRLAEDCGVAFAILDCQAPLPLLRERVQQRHARGGDASEADVAVLEDLAKAAEPLDAAERAVAIEVDTARPLALAPLVARWQAAALAP